MPRVTQAGTFVFVKGNIIVDGWGIDAEGDEKLTNHTVTLAIVDYLRETIAGDPTLVTHQVIKRAMEGPTGG